MSNMSSALTIRDRIIEKELTSKSIEELLKIKEECKSRISNRIQNSDNDDTFVSNSLDQTTVSTIDHIIKNSTKKSYNGKYIEIDDYVINIIEQEKQHYKIVNKSLNLNVEYFGCSYGKVTGKGARKYMDELEELNKQIRKYISNNN